MLGHWYCFHGQTSASNCCKLSFNNNENTDYVHFQCKLSKAVHTVQYFNAGMEYTWKTNLGLIIAIVSH